MRNIQRAWIPILSVLFLICCVIVLHSLPTASAVSIVDSGELNGSLEQLNAMGMPVGWRLTGNPTYTLLSGMDAPSGNYYIQMAKTSKGSASMYSPRIPCTPGKTYELQVMARDVVGKCIVGIYVYTADGTRIDEACKSVNTDGSGKWKMYSIQQVMPANAAAIELEVWGAVASTYTVQIDALSITESSVKLKGTYQPTTYNYPTIDQLLENVTSEYPRVYFTPAEAEQLKNRRNDPATTKYGWSWSSMYRDLLLTADGYLSTETVNVGMNTGKSVVMNIWEDVNSQHNRDLYLSASYADDGTKFEEPYTGFGCLIQSKLSDMMKHWSLAYTLTGKTVYSDQAIKMAMNIASWEWWVDKNWTDKKGIQADASIAWMMDGMVAVYDMCYNEMTPEQRHILERSIIEKGLIPLSKQVNPNSTVNGNMMMVGGILSGAAVIINQNNAAEIYPYLKVGLLAMHNALDNYAFSGNTEGHYYTDFGLETFMPGVGHIYRATKMDGIIDHYFFTDILPYWTIMWATSVTGTHPNYSDGSVSAYMKLPMAVLSKLTQDPLIDGFLVNAGGTENTFDNLVYLNPDPEPEYMSDYSAVIEEFGYGALRTGFAADDMLLTLKANDSQMGHNHYDQNSIQFAVGSNWLLQDPGAGSYYYSDRSFWTHTGHSTILVDGNSQTVRGTGSTKMVFNNNLYSYIIGSAPKAYGADMKGTVLQKFDRHAIQVNHTNKSYYVIIDDLLSSSNRVYTWQIYSAIRMLFSVDGEKAGVGASAMGNRISIPMGKNTLNITFIDNDKLKVTDKEFLSNGFPFAYTMTVDSPSTKAHQFMAVISAQPKAANTYVSFYDILAGRRYTQPTQFVDNDVSWKTDVQSGQATVQPHMIANTPCVSFRGNRAGDYILFPFTVEQAGTYQLQLKMSASDAVSEVKVFLDNEVDMGSIDCTSLSDTLPAIQLGETELSAGKHTILVQVAECDLTSESSFQIDLGGIDLTRTDAEASVSSDVSVTEFIDNKDVLAGMINYAGNSYDFLMFNRSGSSVTAGKLKTNGQQASVLGLQDGVITEGFAATKATTLVYDDKVLFLADQKIDIVASVTGWQIISGNAQTVKLACNQVSENCKITVNGKPVDLKIKNGFLELAVEPGETTITATTEVQEPVLPTEPETEPTEIPTEPETTESIETTIPETNSATAPVQSDDSDNRLSTVLIITTVILLLAGASAGFFLFLKQRKQTAGK